MEFPEKRYPLSHLIFSIIYIMRETEDSQGVRRFADFPRPTKPLAVVPQLSPGAALFPASGL
jgi:hypothetical protein